VGGVLYLKGWEGGVTRRGGEDIDGRWVLAGVLYCGRVWVDGWALVSGWGLGWISYSNWINEVVRTQKKVEIVFAESYSCEDFVSPFLALVFVDAVAKIQDIRPLWGTDISAWDKTM
jgi:hypothetical protein